MNLIPFSFKGIPSDIYPKLVSTFSAQQIAAFRATESTTWLNPGLITQQILAHEQTLKTVALQFYSENSVDQALQELKIFGKKLRQVSLIKAKKKFFNN